MLRVVLYGYARWFVTLWEEHKQRVFENSMLGKDRAKDG